MSTSHAIVDLVSEISNSIDKRKYAFGVFIDLRKAFDTVDHTLLCNKLEVNGIRGIALDLIKSYLNKRSQCVNYDGHTFSLLRIPCMVPLGFMLGPKLFLMYINDMFNVSKILKYTVC